VNVYPQILDANSCSITRGFEQVRLFRGNAPEGVRRANLGYGAFIAIDATISPHLQEQRSITKARAALDTFGAANA
jgi:hypothetical protein